jgi:serine/threonine-protein kinase
MAEVVAPEFIALQQAVLGRYSLERELGRGGMGIVFLARDVALDRPVAIKLLPPAMAAQPALRERFMREARTAAKLSHPNVVPIHAVEEAGDLVFFVMSYVEGETLGERLRARGPLTPREAARLLQEVAWALAYAHGRGVVHRDVKPDNIVIEHGSGRAVVMDFGIAAAGDGSAGEVLGTAAYASPEQLSGEPIDGRSDLYSLGVVGFLSLAGQLPFPADDVAGLVAMHLTRPPPPLAAVAPGVPSRLARAVDRCLAKDPAERFPTGESLAEAIAGTVEPKRELPVPVRIWLTKGADQRVAYAAWYLFAGFPVGMLAGGGVGELAGEALGWMVGVGTYFLLPPLLQTAHRLVRLRRLLAAGYGLADVRLAVRQVADQRREELAYEMGRGPTRWGRGVYLAGWAAGLTMAGGLLALVTGLVHHESQGAVAGGSLVAGLVLLVCRALNRVWPGRRITKDFEAELRGKFWSSRFAHWFERLARLGLKRRVAPADRTYRPTELAIGLAADALFESLPKPQRRELKELPPLITRLQHDAEVMRRTVDDLNGAIAGLGERRGEGPAAAALADTRERLRADLVSRRDEAARRLGAAVTALESIRLNLLRLKAGTGSVTDLTQDLSAAREITERLRLEAGAREEVERLLRGARVSMTEVVRVSREGLRG